MSKDKDSSERKPHPDFPNEPIMGSISGSHPKLLLRRNEDGTYGSPRRSPEEVMHRYEQADSLVDQLVSYFMRKKAEFPEWTDEKNLERIRLALIQKAEQGKWAFTAAEQEWIMARLRERCLETAAGEHGQTCPAPDLDNSTGGDSAPSERSAFPSSGLASTTPLTPEQRRRLIAEGRFAELTPRQAGYEDEDS